MQPHFPYLSFGKSQGWSDIIDREASGIWKKSEIKVFAGNNLKKLIGRKNLWKLKEFLGLQINHPMAIVLREEGIEGLHQRYEENLRIVLEYIVHIFNDLQGDIIITADHGELLGENGDFGHYPGRHHQVLLRVPWFKVTKIK